MTIKQMIISKGKARSGKLLKSFSGVTVHNTGNHDEGADAEANARYLYNNASKIVAGWHYCVDDKEIVQSIPECEIAEHTGTRKGNDTTIGVEICDNSDGDILKATDNAVILVADILMRNGVTKAVHGINIFQHNTWSGKNCPEDIRAEKPYDWNTFVSKVNLILAGMVEKTEMQFSRLLSFKTIKMHGDDVLAVQERLKALGFDSGGVDGIFGKKTRDAVIAFQKARNLKLDGIVGLATWTSLFN